MALYSQDIAHVNDIGIGIECMKNNVPEMSELKAGTLIVNKKRFKTG
ncbi:hypothetical protein [Aliiglaciecola litoralis]